jgi:hypothetical protein
MSTASIAAGRSRPRTTTGTHSTPALAGGGEPAMPADEVGVVVVGRPEDQRSGDAAGLEPDEFVEVAELASDVVGAPKPR